MPVPPRPPDDLVHAEREVLVRKLLEATDGEVLATAEEVAAVLRVERAYVYVHSEELGGRRLHPGKRAPLRFNVWALASRLVPEPAEEPPPRGRRRSRRAPSPELHDSLLPVFDRFAVARPREDAA